MVCRESVAKESLRLVFQRCQGQKSYYRRFFDPYTSSFFVRGRPLRRPKVAQLCEGFVALLFRYEAEQAQPEEEGV